MRLSWVVACLSVALLGGCSAGGDELTAGEAADDLRTAAWQNVVGEYTFSSGDDAYSALVLESTVDHYGHHYFANLVVECFAAPCPPRRQDGWYSVSARNIVLHPSGGSASTFRYAITGGDLTLRSSTVNETLASTLGYCDDASDCPNEGLVHSLCATPANTPQWSCNANRCHWNCAPIPTGCGTNADCPAGETCQAVPVCPPNDGGVTCHSLRLECRPAAHVCTQACMLGRVDCSGDCCVDLQSNANHCGACGNACAAGDTCVAGACVAPHVCTQACVMGRQNCANACCVDLQSDASNCGACGNVCPSGESCRAGTCARNFCTTLCIRGRQNCGGDCCIDPLTNANHCGACGVSCAAGQTCSNGTCI